MQSQRAATMGPSTKLRGVVKQVCAGRTQSRTQPLSNKAKRGRESLVNFDTFLVFASESVRNLRLPIRSQNSSLTRHKHAHANIKPERKYRVLLRAVRVTTWTALVSLYRLLRRRLKVASFLGGKVRSVNKKACLRNSLTMVGRDKNSTTRLLDSAPQASSKLSDLQCQRSYHTSNEHSPLRSLRLDSHSTQQLSNQRKVSCKIQEKCRNLPDSLSPFRFIRERLGTRLNSTTNSWEIISHMTTGQYYCFTAVLPLMVVRGQTDGQTSTDTVELASVVVQQCLYMWCLS